MQMSPWGVLQVVANHEKRVAKHLAVRSLEYYLPLYTERSRWTDRTVLVERPLFNGYVFVRFCREDRLSLISTPGVIRLLGYLDGNTVSAEEINRLRDGLKNGCILRPHPAVPVGTRVKVKSGLFAGVEGMVTEIRDVCKVIIDLAAVNQSFSLDVDISDVEVSQGEPQ